MMGALGEHLERGWLQLYCVDSVDAESWYARWKHPGGRAWRHVEYENYLLHEVLPLMSPKNDNPFLITTGASFGAYHAMNFALRHPDMINRVIAMSGLYDIRSWADGYHDDNIYYNIRCISFPTSTTAGGSKCCAKWTSSCIIGHDDPTASNRWLSGVLWSKGIGNALRDWDGWAHDWPWWLKMISFISVGTIDDKQEAHMLKIGVIVGREWSLPPAFIEEVNRRDEGRDRRVCPSLAARAWTSRAPTPSSSTASRTRCRTTAPTSSTRAAGHARRQQPVHVDGRRQVLRASLATKLGVASPKTVVLPNKEYVPGIVHNESLRNLCIPIDWEEHRRLRRPSRASSRTPTAAAGSRSTSATRWTS